MYGRRSTQKRSFFGNKRKPGFVSLQTFIFRSPAVITVRHAHHQTSQKTMRLRVFLATALAVSVLSACPHVAHADEAAAASSSDGTPPDFATLKISALRAILSERGLECRGCAEKTDFVEMARGNYHLPVVEKVVEQEPAKETKTQSDKMNDRDLEEMMKSMGMNSNANTGDPEKDAILNKLKAKGINMMGKDGMNGMDIEQLRKLEQAMGGMGGAGMGGGMETGGRKKRTKKKADETPTEEL